MDMSREGLEILISLEDKKLTMYHDPIGIPTIGVGHRLSRDDIMSGKIMIHGMFFYWKDGLKSEEVDELLNQDVTAAAAVITEVVTVPLTQPQFDALVSFVFNIGFRAFRYSTLLRQLNTGDYSSVPTQMRRWIFAGHVRLPALEARREKEIAMWESSV